jgi:outer membrane biosynthesis protein TonB
VLVAAALFAPRLRPVPPVDPAPQLAGETFELPAPETTDVPVPNTSPASDGVAAPDRHDEGDAPARPTPPARGRPTARSSHAKRSSSGKGEPGSAEGDTGSAPTPALYGAVGERSATDLATAFTRGFPQAASADPIWRAAPLGSAGEADIVLTLDDAGHIEDTQVLGSPSPALTSAVRRTLALIKGRPFVAKGKVTKLHLVASVSADAVHDGLHGDVFAIGGSFAGGEGSAFFALAIGRRIDVRVRVK